MVGPPGLPARLVSTGLGAGPLSSPSESSAYRAVEEKKATATQCLNFSWSQDMRCLFLIKDGRATVSCLVRAERWRRNAQQRGVLSGPRDG